MLRKIQEYSSLSKEFLINILESRRGLFTSPQYTYTRKQKLVLLTSQLCFNLNQWQAISVEDMLELIDFALIKAYVEAESFGRLKSFLTGN